MFRDVDTEVRGTKFENNKNVKGLLVNYGTSL